MLHVIKLKTIDRKAVLYQCSIGGRSGQKKSFFEEFFSFFLAEKKDQIKKNTKIAHHIVFTLNSKNNDYPSYLC